MVLMMLMMDQIRNLLTNLLLFLMLMGQFQIRPENEDDHVLNKTAVQTKRARHVPPARNKPIPALFANKKQNNMLQILIYSRLKVIDINDCQCSLNAQSIYQLLKRNTVQGHLIHTLV